MWLQRNGLFISRKNPSTDDRGGWEHRFLDILKKEHLQIPGINTIQGVFMKHSWNFRWWCCFRLWNFYQQGVSHNFAEFAGVKACFLEVPKVTYLKISFFFQKSLSMGRNKGKCFTRHHFTKVRNPPEPWRFWRFSLLDHQEMAFPHLKGKVTLEKTSKWN